MCAPAGSVFRQKARHFEDFQEIPQPRIARDMVTLAEPRSRLPRLHSYGGAALWPQPAICS
jgi:hypothetical protein